MTPEKLVEEMASNRYNRNRAESMRADFQMLSDCCKDELRKQSENDLRIVLSAIQRGEVVDVNETTAHYLVTKKDVVVLKPEFQQFMEETK